MSSLQVLLLHIVLIHAVLFGVIFSGRKLIAKHPHGLFWVSGLGLFTVLSYHAYSFNPVAFFVLMLTSVGITGIAFLKN